MWKKEKPKKKKLNKNKLGRGENLSFYDIEKLMQHDCYRRVNGAIKRVCISQLQTQNSQPQSEKTQLQQENAQLKQPIASIQSTVIPATKYTSSNQYSSVDLSLGRNFSRLYFSA